MLQRFIPSSASVESPKIPVTPAKFQVRNGRAPRRFSTTIETGRVSFAHEKQEIKNGGEATASRLGGSAEQHSTFKSVYLWTQHQIDLLPPSIDERSRKMRTLTTCFVLETLMSSICADTYIWEQLRDEIYSAIFVDKERTLTRDELINNQANLIEQLREKIDSKALALVAARRIADESLAKSVATSMKTIFVAWRTVSQAQRTTRAKLNASLSLRNKRVMLARRFSWWRQLATSARFRRALNHQTRVPHRTARDRQAPPPAEALDLNSLRQRLSDESSLRDRQFDAFSFEVSNLNADVAKLTLELRRCQCQKALWRSLWLSYHSETCLPVDVPQQMLKQLESLISQINVFVNIHELENENALVSSRPDASLKRPRKSLGSPHEKLPDALSFDAAKLGVRLRLEGLLIQWVNKMLTHRESALGSLPTVAHTVGATRTLSSLREDLADGTIYMALLHSIQLVTMFSGKKCVDEFRLGSADEKVSASSKLVFALQSSMAGHSKGSHSILSCCTDEKVLERIFDEECVLYGDDLHHMWILSALLIYFCARLRAKEPIHHGDLKPLRDAPRFKAYSMNLNQCGLTGYTELAPTDANERAQSWQVAASLQGVPIAPIESFDVQTPARERNVVCEPSAISDASRSASQTVGGEDSMGECTPHAIPHISIINATPAALVQGGTVAAHSSRSLTKPHKLILNQPEHHTCDAAAATGTLYGDSNALLTIGNPTERLIHLRWYRESFDPCAPLLSTDYLRPVSQESEFGDSEKPLFVSDHPELGTTEHPPFLTMSELMKTLDFSLADSHYDAIQWYRAQVEIDTRLSRWDAIGNAIAAAIADCRCLDTHSISADSELLNASRPRKPSRNQSSEGVGLGLANPIGSPKQRLSNSKGGGTGQTTRPLPPSSHKGVY